MQKLEKTDKRWIDIKCQKMSIERLWFYTNSRFIIDLYSVIHILFTKIITEFMEIFYNIYIFSKNFISPRILRNPERKN